MAKGVSLQGGCYETEYPARSWHRVKCGVNTQLHHTILKRRKRIQKSAPAIVGFGNDYFASSSAPITFASGSFPDVANLRGEKSILGEGAIDGVDQYTLQLNTNLLGSPICVNSHQSLICLGWEQFVYSTDYVRKGTAGLFIQYWLIDYAYFNPACPLGWHTWGDDCWKNSRVTQLPNIPITQLGTMQLAASATNDGNDIAILFVGTKGYLAMADDNVLDIASLWNQVEFNVFGDAGGSEAFFYPGTYIGVRIGVLGNTNLTCEDPVPGGATAETNNLTLGTCQAGTTSLGSEINFFESWPIFDHAPVGQFTIGSDNSLKLDAFVPHTKQERNVAAQAIKLRHQ